MDYISVLFNVSRNGITVEEWAISVSWNKEVMEEEGHLPLGGGQIDMYNSIVIRLSLCFTRE